jgi:hypothetical protein
MSRSFQKGLDTFQKVKKADISDDGKVISAVIERVKNSIDRKEKKRQATYSKVIINDQYPS